MGSIEIKSKILGVLAENVNGNKYPDLVTSATIASRLNISTLELKEAMRLLCATGVIESDPDHEHALITREGMHWLDERAYQGPQ